MTSFVLLVGYSPFEHENREMVCQQIKAGAWSFYEPDWRKISREAQDLIEGLLQVDPVERLSASEALQSKWFQQSEASLSRRDLSGSITKLKTRRRALRARALTWIASKTGPLLHGGFISKPIESPTQANEILCV